MAFPDSTSQYTSVPTLNSVAYPTLEQPHLAGSGSETWILRAADRTPLVPASGVAGRRGVVCRAFSPVSPTGYQKAGISQIFLTKPYGEVLHWSARWDAPMHRDFTTK